MNPSKGRKRPKPNGEEQQQDDSANTNAKTNANTMPLTPAAAAAASPSERCWKCKGTGLKFQKSTRRHDGPPCKVCNGEGIRKRSQRAKILASEPGKIPNLRGYPSDHILRGVFPEGFAGPRAVRGRDGDGLLEHLRPKPGEVVGSLGCGDWRIYQIANGNKLTVDDFVCAWVAAEEMRKRGYGLQLHRDNPLISGVSGGNGNGNINDNYNDDHNDHNDDQRQRMFGGSRDKISTIPPNDNDSSTGTNHHRRGFNHADIGTGCGSVLMMTAWAFLGEIRSVGVEAQEVSFGCLKRGLEWNLGSDGTHPGDVVQIQHNDLRTWDGRGIGHGSGSTAPCSDPARDVGGGGGKDTLSSSSSSSPLCPPYRLITGTPPYFPTESFVASQNHEQKVRCRVPTRGGAPDYIETASRFLLEEQSDGSGEGVFCMVEAAFDKAEAGVMDAVEKYNMRVRRRVDVITRTGLPPRFSCWVMTKKNKKKKKPLQPVPSTETTSSGETDRETRAENHDDKENDDADNHPKFPIETLTLRNADLTRTQEYTNAMEIMGWVDFEKSERKTAKTVTKMNCADSGSG